MQIFSKGGIDNDKREIMKINQNSHLIAISKEKCIIQNKLVELNKIKMKG